jgi:uncharacterized membrane protein
VGLARTRDRAELATTGAVFALLGGVGWLLLQPVLALPHTESLLVSFRTLTGIAAAVALVISHDALRRSQVAVVRGVSTVVGVLAHIVALAVLALEAHDLFARHASTWTVESSVSAVSEVPAFIAGAWAVYGCAVHVAGRRLTSEFHSRSGLAMLALACLCAVAAVVSGDAARHLVLNTRALGCGAAIAALCVAAEIHRRRPAAAAEPGAASLGELASWLVLATHVLVIALLTREALDHFATLPVVTDGSGWLDRDDARQLSLSLIWALYGIGMVVTGFVRRFQPVRVMALGLLAVTVLKVFLLDLSFLATPYRVLSFIVLGGVLVGVSYLYQRQARSSAAERSADAAPAEGLE